MDNNKNQIEIKIFGLKLLLMAADTAFFALLWFHYFDDQLYAPFWEKGNWFIIAVFFIIYYWAADLYGGFQVKIKTPSELLYSHSVAAILTTFLFYFITWVLMRRLPNILIFVGMDIVLTALAFLWSFPVHRYIKHIDPPRRTVIIYHGKSALNKARRIMDMFSWRFDYAGAIDAGSPDEIIDEYIKKNAGQAVMLFGIDSTRRDQLLLHCRIAHYQVFVRTNIGDLMMDGSVPMQVSDLTLSVCDDMHYNFLYLAAKRMFDIIFSLIGMIIASPFMLIIAAAIKIYDRGPVFYKQQRYTKDRKVFAMLKFRSMKPNAEGDGVARLATENDDRITPVGRIIRAIRFDELPQLFNILKGDMSLVGPRPERPEIADEYEKTVPQFALRLQVKAGLTGYAQVYGKYNTAPYDKLQLDLQYIAKQSLLMDFRIILITIKILFEKSSTEGIGDDMINAAESDDDEN